MINEHDQDVTPRCRRLGHEVAFNYCRRENRGKPCRCILDCWWERFDVRGFLKEHLSPEEMLEIEGATHCKPASRVLTLLELAQQTKGRLALDSHDAGQLKSEA